jgi:hypothetical protein
MLAVLIEVLYVFLGHVCANVPCALKVAMTFPVHIIHCHLYIGCCSICVLGEVSLNELRHKPRDYKSFLNCVSYSGILLWSPPKLALGLFPVLVQVSLVPASQMSILILSFHNISFVSQAFHFH